VQAQVSPEELETFSPQGKLATGRMITGKGNEPLPVSLRPHFVAPHFVAPRCTSPRLAADPAPRCTSPRVAADPPPPCTSPRVAPPLLTVKGGATRGRSSPPCTSPRLAADPPPPCTSPRLAADPPPALHVAPPCGRSCPALRPIVMMIGAGGSNRVRLQRLCGKMDGRGSVN
jgi:hypothetical protein